MKVQTQRGPLAFVDAVAYMKKGRKRSVISLVAVLMAGGLAAFLTNRWFVNPQVTDVLVPADAIVVFPGGEKADERFERAIELMDEGLAPVLFVATDTKQTELERRVCEGTSFDFQTACRLSVPRNTHGNSIATAAEADLRNWNSIILVTSDDHITRSHMLLRRCYEGDIQTAISVQETLERERFKRTTHEWGGMVKALFTDRC